MSFSILYHTLSWENRPALVSISSWWKKREIFWLGKPRLVKYIAIYISQACSLLRLGIFLGFAAFFFMEKTLRVLGGDEEDAGHSHTHSHSHVEPQVTKASGASGSTTQNGLRSRNSDTSEVNNSPIGQHEGSKLTNGPSKLSAYLNLFGDFVHNM